VAVLDHLAVHKVRGVRKALGRSGAGLLSLPPYAPGFNPIEPAFAKHIKTLLPRRPHGLLTVWSWPLLRYWKPFSPEECANCFTHAGQQ
jgi:transposase